jgi:hypothetical protein
MQLQGLLEAWVAPTDVATFRGALFGQCALFRDAAHERLAPVLALASWNVREIFSQHTSKFIAWFQAKDGHHVTAEVSAEAAQRLYCERSSCATLHGASGLTTCGTPAAGRTPRPRPTGSWTPWPRRSMA